MKSRSTTKRFTEPGRSRGYLHGILLDGAKPFLYRGGARALLGVPDGGGGITYAPPLPPAGFQYVHRSADGPRPDASDGDHEVVKEYPDRIVRSSSIEAEYDDAVRPSRAEEVVMPVQRASAAPPAQPAERTSARAAASESSQREQRREAPSIAAPEIVPPAAVVKPQPSSVASLEVPGMSHAVRDFPSLRTTVKPEELAVRCDEGSASRESARPAEPRETRAPGEHAYRPDPPSPPAPAPIAMPRREQARVSLESRIDTTEGEETIESIEHIDPASASVRRAHEESVTPITRRIPQMPVQGRRIPARTEVVEEGPYLEPADPTAGALSIRGALDGKRRGTQEGVEQIVERVIARRAAEERGGWESAERRQAPEPARVVVLDNRAAQGPKIPCAFWERSYLHRFRIRTLR